MSPFSISVIYFRSSHTWLNNLLLYLGIYCLLPPKEFETTSSTCKYKVNKTKTENQGSCQKELIGEQSVDEENVDTGKANCYISGESEELSRDTLTQA